MPQQPQSLLQKIIFTKGMNFDDGDEVLAEGSGRRRVNVRVMSSKNGQRSAVETPLGNNLTSYTLPSGTNKVIGAREWEIKNKCFYHVWNSNGNHVNLMYDIASNSVTKVLQDDPSDPYLNYDKDHLITHIDFVELDGDNWLWYWTDNYVDPTDKDIYNEPKKLNIQKAIAYSAGNYSDGYPALFDPEFIFRIKQPPQNSPVCLYGDDPTRVVNMMEQKLFQFKARFIYDDKEASAWSPISVFAYPNDLCGGGSTRENNFIAVTVPTGIAIVERIQIACKEVNAPDFALVVDLDKEELEIPSNDEYTFNFYNDGNYIPLEINDSIKLYDRVPKHSQAEAVIDGNRMADGHITEDFDQPGVDMKFDVRVEEDITEPTYSIRGKIFIPMLFPDASGDSGYQKSQAIWSGKHATGYPVFGGIGSNAFGGYMESIDSYNQHLPEGGFCVYLAGTNHSTISVQQGNGLPTDPSYPGKNVYEINGISARNDVRDHIKDESAFSTFEISGVPPGKYILRIAPSSDQSTSTNTAGVGGYAKHECVVYVANDGTITVPGISSAGPASPFHLQDSYVLDLTSAKTRTDFVLVPQIIPRTCTVTGYLRDNTGRSIEMGTIFFTRGDPFEADACLGILSAELNNAWGGSAPFIDEVIADILYDPGSGTPQCGKTVCDHNGFYYSLSAVGNWLNPPTTGSVCGLVDYEIHHIQVATNTQAYSVVSGGTSYDCWGSAIGVIEMDVLDDDIRTRLVGFVYFQGRPLDNVICISTRGGIGATDANGLYAIDIYPANDATTRADYVLFYLNGECIAFFTPGTDIQAYGPLQFGPSDYNYNNPYQLQNVYIDAILGQTPINALKRGGVYQECLIYLDHANRSSVSLTNEGRFDVIDPETGKYGSKVFIPWYTDSKESADPANITFTMKVTTDGTTEAILTEAGSGYTSPAATFSGGGAGVQATADIFMDVLTAIITASGAGYTAATATISGGGGSGATADVNIVAGVVVGLTITDPGTGYTSVPGIVIAGDGAGATADAVMEIEKVVILTTGSGYTSVPALTITDGGTPTVVATASFYMEVEALTLVSGGSGYTVPPAIIFTGGGTGIGAAGTTTLTLGVITAVALTSGGAGYTSFPTLLLEGGNPYLGSIPIVDWAVYNEPPKWAKKWLWARMKNSETDHYIQFIANETEYVDDNHQNVGPLTQVRINLLNITAQFKTMNPDSILVYDFARGDRIRYVKNKDGAFFTQYYDLKVKSYDSGTGDIYVEVDNSITPSDLDAGVMFEIYYPKLTIPDDQRITFEFGETYDVLYDSVHDKYYHAGERNNQAYWNFDGLADDSGFLQISSSSTPHGMVVGNKIRIMQNGTPVNPGYDTYANVTAVIDPNTIVVDIVFGSADAARTGQVTLAANGTFYTGDTFYRYRIMPYNNTALNTLKRLIQDANFDDGFYSKAWDYGRPNKIDKLVREVTRGATVYYSEKFIPETQINGLSSVYDTSFQSYDSNNGTIQKLWPENARLLMFQELKVSQIPVNQILYNDLQLQNTVGASNVVLSPQPVPYIGEYGIGRNPESFAVYGQAKYFIDVRRGVLLRLSNDGITPISINSNMHSYFSTLCEQVIKSGVNVKFFGGFDLDFTEYILSHEGFTYSYLGPDQERIDVTVPGETVAFNEDENYFSTFYSYLPDFMCRKGNGIISFKNGALWVHNSVAVPYANYYGVQYKPFVSAVMNAFSSNKKVFIAIALEGDQPWNVVITTPSGQESPLISNNFYLHEGFQYAEFKRDQNTPNVVNPIIEGDPMRGQTALLELEYQSDDYNKLYAFNVLFISSQRSNK